MTGGTLKLILLKSLNSLRKIRIISSQSNLRCRETTTIFREELGVSAITITEEPSEIEAAEIEVTMVQNVPLKHVFIMITQYQGLI